jgi:uncharacterized membrane protein YhhN
MEWGWYVVLLLVAGADWVAVARKNRKIRAVTKPAVMVLLLAGYSLAGGWVGQGYWFGLGFVLSLVGDIFLLLSPGYFIFGLAGFLLAHVFYIVGFNQGAPVITWGSLALLLVFIAFDALGYRRLQRALLDQPNGRRLRYPVAIYIIVITVMVLSAFSTLFRADWPQPAALLVSLGAMLFFVSDFTLANDRFAGPLKGGRVIVIVTYHLAQVLIASGVLLR